MQKQLWLVVGVMLSAGLVGCTSGTGVPRSSGSLAVSNDSQFLYAADTDNGVLIVLDARSVTRVSSVKVGERPYRVAVGADDTVFVANRGSRSVSVIARGDWSVRAELHTGVDPVGMQVSSDGKTLYVVSATANDTAEYGTLQAFETATLAEKWVVPVGEEPRGLALVSDDRAMVSLYHSGELVHVDLAAGQVIDGRIDVYSNINKSELASASTSDVRGTSPVTFHPRATSDLAATPDGTRVFAPTLISRDAPILVAPSATRPYYQEQGPRLAGSVSTPAVLTFDTSNGHVTPLVDDVSDTTAEFTGANDGLPYPQTSYAVRAPLFGGGVGGPSVPENPVLQGPTVAVVDMTGQWLFMVNRESSNVSVISTDRRVAKPDEANDTYVFGRNELPSVHSTAKVGAGADGIAVLGNNTEAFVYNQFDHTVQRLVVGNGGLTASGPVNVTGDVLTNEQVVGRKMFFDANDRRISSAGASVACSSCHLEGRDDGHVWKFPDGPRQTPTLAGRGMSATGPYHWSGEFSSMDEFLNHTIIQRMGGTGLDNPAERRALDAFVDSLPAPENPTHQTELTAQQLRGAAAFGKAQCGTCHSGQWLTNNNFVDVGTLDTNKLNPDTVQGLNVPSLKGLSRSAPYLHTGAARTLRERIANNPGDRHGKTSILSAPEMDDLVAYLKSL
ncbi:MAG: c-type cytochrome [Myxococcaceae bacterium]|nr:c-type cytochrome [Myxococcaceae bacterium]